MTPEAKELYFYIKNRTPFMNELEVIAAKRCHASASLINLIGSAMRQYIKDYCSKGKSPFSYEDVREVHDKLYEELLSSKPITEVQAREFYGDLCRTFNGNVNRTSQGVASVIMIADRMNITVDRASELCQALIDYRITEQQGGMIVV